MDPPPSNSDYMDNREYIRVLSYSCYTVPGVQAPNPTEWVMGNPKPRGRLHRKFLTPYFSSQGDDNGRVVEIIVERTKHMRETVAYEFLARSMPAEMCITFIAWLAHKRANKKRRIPSWAPNFPHELADFMSYSLSSLHGGLYEG